MDDVAGQKNSELGTVRREAAFVFIFATVLLDMLAVEIIIPVLPKLVFDFLGGNAKSCSLEPACADGRTQSLPE